MRQIIIIGILISFTFGFFACGGKPDLIFYAEKYWWNLIAQEIDLSETLEKICQEKGVNLKIIIKEPEENYGQDLKKIAEQQQVKIIITGTMSLNEVDSIASVLPGKQFIVLGAPELYKFTSANIMAVVFDRRASYARAGQIVAELLNPDYYYMYDKLQNAKVGIIFSLDSEKGREQVQKFKEGFTEQQPDDRLVTEILENANDRVQAVRAVETLNAQNVKIFLLKNYSLIPACVQKITALNSYFIIEDWKYYRENIANLLFSIEASIPQAFNAAMQFTELSNGEIHPTYFKTLSIPCKIFWGKALIPPSILKNEIVPWDSNNK